MRGLWLRHDFSLCLVLSVEQQGGGSRSCGPVRQIIFSQHPPGGGHQAGIVVGVVLGLGGPRAQQRQVVSVGAGQEEGRAPLALALLQGVRERLAFALGQQHDTEHREYGEGGEDHVVQEVAAVVLELHQGGGGHADAAGRQHQAEAAATDAPRERENFMNEMSDIQVDLNRVEKHYRLLNLPVPVSCRRKQPNKTASNSKTSLL